MAHATAASAADGAHTHTISLASTAMPRGEKNRCRPIGDTRIGRQGKK